MPDSDGSRVARWRGLGGLAWGRIRGDVTRGGPSRTGAAIGIVAIAIALLVVVTSVSLGLAAQTTVRGENVDYWIAPRTGSTLTTVVSVEGPQLGDVHANAAAIRDIEGVTDATPVLIELVQLRTRSGSTAEYVLGVGVIVPEHDTTIAGVSTSALTSGDPYYADGDYDGEFTGEVVLSPAAADLLGGAAGDDLLVSSPASTRIAQSFAISAVSESGSTAVQSQLPVAVFHLSELQAFTGARSGDQADQLLVQTTNPRVKPALERIYPEATVVARSGLGTQQLFDADLPVAMSLTALVIGLVVAALFVATTMGLTVEADRRELAVLAALGYATRTRVAVVAAMTLSITILGGVIGVILGFAGIGIVNLAATTVLASPAIAVPEPILVPYGLGVAVAMGVLAAPYPSVLARRTNTLEELGR